MEKHVGQVKDALSGIPRGFDAGDAIEVVVAQRINQGRSVAVSAQQGRDREVVAVLFVAVPGDEMGNQVRRCGEQRIHPRDRVGEILAAGFEPAAEIADPDKVVHRRVKLFQRTTLGSGFQTVFIHVLRVAGPIAGLPFQGHSVEAQKAAHGEVVVKSISFQGLQFGESGMVLETGEPSVRRGGVTIGIGRRHRASGEVLEHG